MSRTNDRRFLFVKGRIKTQLVDALKRAAAFSGVELEAYVAMDNHFHKIGTFVGSVPAMLIVNVIGNLPRFVRWQ